MNESPQDVSRPEADPRLALGKLFAEARKSKGLTLEDAAKALKIRKEFLIALEAGEWGRIGEAVYARGFAREYARFLGVEADGYLDAIGAPKPELELPVVYTDAPITPGRRIGYAAGVLLVLLLIGTWLWGAKPHPRKQPIVEETISAAVESDASHLQPVSSTPKVAASSAGEDLYAQAHTFEKPALPAPPRLHRIVVRAKGGKLWVQWRAPDGRALKEALLQDGEAAVWEGKEARVDVVVGNAAAAEIEADGKVIAKATSLGPQGKVRKLSVEFERRQGQPAAAPEEGAGD